MRVSRQTDTAYIPVVPGGTSIGTMRRQGHNTGTISTWYTHTLTHTDTQTNKHHTTVITQPTQGSGYTSGPPLRTANGAVYEDMWGLGTPQAI